jgi:hypothetical protein
MTSEREPRLLIDPPCWPAIVAVALALGHIDDVRLSTQIPAHSPVMEGQSLSRILLVPCPITGEQAA